MCSYSVAMLPRQLLRHGVHNGDVTLCTKEGYSIMGWQPFIHR